MSKQPCSHDACTFSDTCSPVRLMQLILQVHQTVSGLWEQKGVFHQKLPPERSPALLRVSPQLTLLTWKGLKEVNTSWIHPLEKISSLLFPFSFYAQKATDLNKIRNYLVKKNQVMDLTFMKMEKRGYFYVYFYHLSFLIVFCIPSFLNKIKI